MFILFASQGKILGVFQRQKIVSAIFNGEKKQTTVICEIAGKEQIFIFPSELKDFTDFTVNLCEILPRFKPW